MLRRPGATGATGNRCATSGSTSFSMSAASPPTCYGGMAAVPAAPASTITRPAASGRRTRWSRRCAWRGSPPRASSTARSIPTRSARMSTRSSSRRCGPATSLCSTTWRSIRSPRFAPPIEAAGAALRFLPPYSPDFNPIEQAFAKLKAFLRAARPRSFDDVCALVAAALRLFTPTECRNFVRHSGYRLTTTL